MTDERSWPFGEAVGRRLGPAVRFLAANRRALLVDAVAIVAWVVLLAVTFGLMEWPLLVYYLALVTGIVVYTLLRDPLDVPGG